MDAAVLLVGLLGLVVGAAVVLGAVALHRSRDRADRREDSALSGRAGDLPEGVPQLLAVLGGPAVVVDSGDAVVRASPEAYAAGIVAGSELAHADLVLAARETREDGEVRELEVDLVPTGPSRVTRVLGVRVAPLGDHHVVLLGADRTEARRLDEVRRDFVVNVSHELKTPVGALSLLAEATADAADDPEAVARFAGRMQVESKRLALLVHDIVELSRLQDGAPPAGPSREDLDRLVAEAIDRCGALAEARGIAVEVGPPSGAAVVGDPELITTAVRNLVDNALRYSEPGTRVGVGVARRDGWAEVSVTDQGIGIGPEERERVFERFYRVDPARSRATGGTGLGLSIVKHVASVHGGDVQLWSQVGHGSTFTLRLPEAAHEPVHASVHEPPTSEEEHA